MTALELKEIRAQKRMTQGEFAEWVGVKRRTVIAWENGQNPIPEIAEKRIRAAEVNLNPQLSLDIINAARAEAERQGLTLYEWIGKLIVRHLAKTEAEPSNITYSGIEKRDHHKLTEQTLHVAKDPKTYQV